MVDQIHVVGVLIENSNGEILLLQRQKNKPEPDKYGPPGGKINFNETKENACVREIYEEIGLKIIPANLKFLKTYNNKWQSNGLNIKFEAFKLNLLSDGNPKLVLANQESSAYIWLKPESAHKRKDLMPGLYIILKDIYNL